VPVETSSVQISINVVDSSSGEVIANVIRNLDNLGDAGARAGQKAAQGLGSMGSHVTTSLDSVRLLSQEFGLRLPRAMESAIARSEALSGAIGAASGALLAFGAAEVFFRMAQGAYELYNKTLSLKAATEAYNTELQKAKDEDFGNTHSIETTIARIREATSAAQDFVDQANQMNRGGWDMIQQGLLRGNAMQIATGAGLISQARASAVAGFKLDNQADKLTPKQIGDQHDQRMLLIEREHAGDAQLRGEQKITAEYRKRLELAAETRQYETAQDSLRGNPVAPDAGKSKQDLQKEIAYRQAQAETYNLERQQAQQLAHMRAEAAQSAMQGEERYKAQEAAAIDELKYRDLDSAAARNAVHLKFHNEEMERLHQQNRETEKRSREAATSGLNGIPAIRAKASNEIADVDANYQDGKYFGNAREQLAAADSDKAAINAETNARILAQEQDFSQRVEQLAQQRADREVQGYGRIRAEADRELSALQKDYEKVYGSDPNGADYRAHVGQLNSGRAAISGMAQDQTAELQRRNQQETERIESQANAKFLSAEKQKTAAIDEEYKERLQSLQEQLQQQQISWDDYNRRVSAAGKQRDAEMVEASTQAREKMAGQFAELFRDPLHALEDIGTKQAGQAAASLYQRVTSGGGRATSPDDWWNSLAGKHKDAPVRTMTHAGSAGASSSMAIDSANITIGSANIAGGFSGGGGSVSGGGYRMPDGSIMPPSSGPSAGGYSISGGGSAPVAYRMPDGSLVPTSMGAGSVGTSTGGTPVGSAPPMGAGISGVAGQLQQGYGAYRQISSLMTNSGDAGSPSNPLQLSASGGTDPLGLNAPDTSGSIGINAPGDNADGSAASGLAGAASTAMSAGGDALGLFSAYKQGGAGGMLTGAISGAKLGAMVGGPIGAGIGALAGLAIGAFGGGEQARLWWLKQGQPRLLNDMAAYNQGSMDYLTAYVDIENLRTDAKHTLSKMGFAGKRELESTVDPELNRYEQSLTREQKAGRSASGFSAAQYDIGTDYVPRDGMAMIHEGERIVPSDQNERITSAMEAISGTRMPAATGGGDVNLHVHAIDARGAMDFLMQNKHGVRAALNSSYAENGGPSDF
jgi:fatty acid-binding protein DegV